MANLSFISLQVYKVYWDNIFLNRIFLTLHVRNTLQKKTGLIAKTVLSLMVPRWKGLFSFKQSELENNRLSHIVFKTGLSIFCCFYSNILEYLRVVWQGLLIKEASVHMFKHRSHGFINSKLVESDCAKPCGTTAPAVLHSLARYDQNFIL